MPGMPGRSGKTEMRGLPTMHLMTGERVTTAMSGMLGVTAMPEMCGIHICVK